MIAAVGRQRIRGGFGEIGLLDPPDDPVEGVPGNPEQLRIGVGATILAQPVYDKAVRVDADRSLDHLAGTRGAVNPAAAGIAAVAQEEADRVPRPARVGRGLAP